MSLVWRKIQRSNKKAAKYRFVAELRELTIHCGNKWQPEKVAVTWTHRRRRYSTKDHQWEPSITDPYRGIIVWPAEDAECIDVVTTLYRNSKQQAFDDKEWTFIIEGLNSRGKRKALAGLNLNLRLFVDELPGTQTELKLKLKPMCEHVTFCTLKLLLSCQMLKEGNALDDDMQSVASAMSVSQRRTLTTGYVNIMKLNAKETSESSSTNVFHSLENFLKNYVIYTKNHTVAEIADLSELDNLSPCDSSQSMNAITPSSPISPRESLPTEIADLAAEINETWRQPREPSPFESQYKPVLKPPQVRPVSGNDSSSPKRTSSTSQAPKTTTEVTKIDELSTSFSSNAVGEVAPTGADLLSWCQAVTRGYPGVNVTDFSRSWRNGLAFCALIHRFRPELIGDFDALAPENIRINCKKAFDAAATLGVPKLIDPDEMVIMVVPDKIAVTSYVYNLRATLTGQTMKNSFYERDSFSSSWTASTIEDRRSSGSSVKSSNRSSTTVVHTETKDSSSVPQTTAPTATAPQPSKSPLMTRNQLMNPFDSDEEDQSQQQQSTTKSTNAQANNQSPTPTPTPTPTTTTPPMQQKPSTLVPVSTKSSLDRRQQAKMLLQQLQTETRAQNRDKALTPENEKRRHELQQEARRLIELVQTPNVIKVSDTISQDMLQRLQRQSNQKESSSEPTTRHTTPEHNYVGQSRIVRQTSNTSATTGDSAFNRFRRLGSMRTQELTQTINQLSSRFAQSTARRSVSMPKDLSNHQKSACENTADQTSSPVKVDDALEHDPRSRHQLLAEIEALAQRQKELDEMAANVEDQWRKVSEKEPGSDREQSLMNEYLRLLNERNMLTRRDMYLNILEKIRDEEQQFQEVQRQLGEFLQLEDSEKTEVHKRQIDSLMEKLIEIVNRRDELVQQLMAHEQGTQEAAELAEGMFGQALVNDDQKNCVIQ